MLNEVYSRETLGSESPQLSTRKLRTYKHFSQLSKNRLALVLSLIDSKHAGVGEVILNIDQRDPRSYFLIDGVLELTAVDGKKLKILRRAEHHLQQYASLLQANADQDAITPQPANPWA